MTEALHGVFDNSLGFIRQTDIEDRVMHHPAFSRLHHVYQNSCAYLTWPTMRNQRFEHSLGVKELAGEVFFKAVQNTESDVLERFYQSIEGEIVWLVDNIGAESIDACGCSGSSFKQLAKKIIASDDEAGIPRYHAFLVPSNVKPQNRVVHYILMQSIRLAGMLHDVGHPPFSHVCESALSEAYRSIRAKQLESCALTPMEEDLFNAVGQVLGDVPLEETQLHEEIGKRLSHQLLAAICKTERNPQFNALYVMEMLVTESILRNDSPFAPLHSIVSGTVDVDRIDFVKRDSINSGYGPDVQHSRIVDGVKIVESKVRIQSEDEMRTVFLMAFPCKALDAIETFLRKRFANYRTIIYHHNVVKSDALLKSVVATLVKREIDDPLKKPTELMVMPRDISGLWHPLAKSVNGTSDELLAFSQWTDAWLISMLTDEYTRLKTSVNDLDSEDESLLSQLGELLFAEEHHHSLVKRSIDCEPFRSRLKERFEEDRNDKWPAPSGGREPSLDSVLGQYRESKGRGDSVPGDPTLDILKRLANGFDNPNLNVMAEFASEFDLLTAGKGANFKGTEYTTLEEFIEAVVEQYLEGKREPASGRVLVGRNSIKAGTREDVFFYMPDSAPNGDGDSIVTLKQISRLPKVLAEEIADMPAFFVYIPSSEDPVTSKFRNSVENELACQVFEAMRNTIITASNMVSADGVE